MEKDERLMEARDKICPDYVVIILGTVFFTLGWKWLVGVILGCVIMLLCHKQTWCDLEALKIYWNYTYADREEFFKG